MNSLDFLHHTKPLETLLTEARDVKKLIQERGWYQYATTTSCPYGISLVVALSQACGTTAFCWYPLVEVMKVADPFEHTIVNWEVQTGRKYEEVMEKVDKTIEFLEAVV